MVVISWLTRGVVYFMLHRVVSKRWRLSLLVLHRAITGRWSLSLGISHPYRCCSWEEEEKGKKNMVHVSLELTTLALSAPRSTD